MLIQSQQDAVKRNKTRSKIGYFQNEQRHHTVSVQLSMKKPNTHKYVKKAAKRYLQSGRKSKVEYNFVEDEEMSKIKLKANRSQNDLRYNSAGDLSSDNQSCDEHN